MADGISTGGDQGTVQGTTGGTQQTTQQSTQQTTQGAQTTGATQQGATQQATQGTTQASQATQGTTTSSASAQGTTQQQSTTQGTIAEGGTPKSAEAAPAPATFPEKWREELAGGDAAFAKVLERYASPKAFAEAHRALVAKVSSGELKNVAKAPPEGSTPEQIAEWRKEAGLPAEPKGYVDAIKLPNGVVPGEADRPLLEGFAAHALKSNMTSDAFNTAVGWYFDNVDAQNKARAETDHAFAGASVRTLEAEWGPSFKENQNRLGALFADTPSVADLIYSARDKDGRILGNIPEVCRALAQLHRESFPAYSPTTADNFVSGEALSTEMSKIESMMGDPRSAYNEKMSSGSLTEAAQKIRSRYRDLVDQQRKNKSRAA